MTKNIGVDAAKLAGLQIDQNQKLRNRQLTIEQIEWFLKLNQKTREGLVRGTHKIVEVEKSPILVRLYPDEEIVVGATTGSKTIANSGDIFTGYLDGDFKNWRTNKPSGIATEPTLAEIYELRQNATFHQMFESLDRDISRIFWDQEQIIKFVQDHRDKLHPSGWGTFFPFKVKKEPFVASVHLASGGLNVFVYRFDYDKDWDAELRDRVVVPQLNP